MKPTVGILTDTVACLPDAHIEALGIGIVPVHLLVGDDDYLEPEISEEEVHRRMAAGEKVSTATPAPGEFVEVFKSMADRGHRRLLMLTVSGRLSNVYNAARLAAESSPVPTTVLDTRTVASAQGLVVRRVAELAGSGARMTDLLDEAARVRSRTGLVAAVPDLASLARTGRVPRIVARIGDRLDLKPIIEVREDGEAHPAGVARSMARAGTRMIRRALDATGGITTSRIVAMHALAPNDAAGMAEALQRRSPGADVEVAPFTAVMSVHTGPGLVGIAWEASP